jgi:PTH1 family peptidyl-tRNA hydrolase
MSGIQLIVGLANPGREYEATRHNAGAWFIEELAKEANIKLRLESKFHGYHGIARLDNHTCHLLIPTTFMNLSGQSVRACMQYNKIEPDALLVAHDEIDLSAGAIKIKYDGGDGGHNGLKDIIRHLNTKRFYRLRIGVGRPAHKDYDIADYVLSAPSKAERTKIDDALVEAQKVLPLMLSGQPQQAMLKLHTEST